MVEGYEVRCVLLCRIQRLMENSISSINVEEFLAEQRRKCNHDSSNFKVDKTITLGKVEHSVQVGFLLCQLISCV